MKQTIDLIHGLRSSSAGLLPKGSKNGQPDTTTPIGSSHCHKHSHHRSSAHSLLCRALLVLTLITGWGSVAVAQETEIWSGSAKQLELSNSVVSSNFPASTESSSSLRVYVEKGGLQALCAGWGNAILKNQTGNGGIDANDETYYVEEGGYYQIPFSACIEDLANSLMNNGFVAQVRDWNNQNIAKISVYTPIDNFPNVGVSGYGTPSYDEEIERNVASKTISLSDDLLAGVKYARIYLADASGTAVNPTDLLTVTYNGDLATAAGENPKNGFYVYDPVNGITLSNISITLHAGAGNFMNYKVICLLADNFSTATPNDGSTPLTQEPQWNLEYTYTFTYPTDSEDALKTKFRTIMYERNNNGQITLYPRLVENWHELSGDCDVSRAVWASNGYVHWYLIDVTNDEPIQDIENDGRIQMGNSAGGYTNLGGVNGWERTGFNIDNLPPAGRDNYNPRFTFNLPNGLTTNDVRLVCDAGISEMTPVLQLSSDFEDGNTGGWRVWGGNNPTCNVVVEDNNHTLHLNNPTANNEAWQSQCGYDLPTALMPNAQYTIRFKARSSINNGSLQFQFQNLNYGNQGAYNTFSVGTAWNSYEYTFSTTYEDTRRILFNFATVAADYWIDDIELETLEPVANVKVRYVFDLKQPNDLLTFIHYDGETHRPYQIVDGQSAVNEYSWDYTDGSIDSESRNIRQSVHQVDYYIYLSDGEISDLALPLEGWSNNDGDDPSGTEPLGFYRWYNWETDGASDYLTRYSVNESTLLDVTNYGFICNWLGKRLGTANAKFRNLIGVNFNAPNNFSSMNEEIVIACDVSRYMDGLDDSKQYLVHEPTLSIRYLFHILPAKTIADEIDSKASMLETIEAGLNDGSITSVTEDDINDMFKLFEDNGRVVVSLNGTEGKFTLRVNLKELGHYRVNNGNNNQVPCNRLQWYAYYQDENGDLWKHTISMDDIVYIINTGNNNSVTQKLRYELRLAKYELTDFLGTYTKLAPGNVTMTLNSLPSGANLHVVGCVSNGTVERPVSNYDLVFLDAGPKPLGTETTQVEQTYALEMNVGAVLTFDDLFSEDESIRLAKPTSSAENYALMPQKWPLGQYGYCYPSLYGQDASSWAIYHSNWNGYGIGPTHSDYMLLKSMNMPNVSYTAGNYADINGTFNTQSYYAWWYSEIDGVEGQNRFPKLFDVTHERLYGKEYVNDGDNAKYGTYMYIDASDEARTYASLEFDASLCAGAQIYYTAYIANMAPNVGRAEDSGERKAPPQVMFRVTTDVNGVRIPVVSFLTGDIESMGANQLGQWYMVSGHTRIPAELESLLDGTPRRFYVSIDNFAENTKGADYCVDEITFYTTSAKVRAFVTSDRCTTDKGTTMRVHADAESLLKALGEGSGLKNIFYRIYKKHDDMTLPIQEGEDFTGHDVYTDASGQANDQFGTVLIDLDFDYVSALQGVADGVLVNSERLTPEPPGKLTSGFYKEGNNYYFQFVERSFELVPGQGYFVSFYNFGYDRVSEPKEWGNPYVGSVCTVYSNFFYSNKVFLKPMETSTGQEADGVIDFGCGITEVDVDFDLKLQFPNDDGTVVAYDDVRYDFFVGRVVWEDENPDDDNPDAQEISKTRFDQVKAAVNALRTITEDPLTKEQLNNLNPSGLFTQEMKDLLLFYMAETTDDHPLYPRLMLNASIQFSYHFIAPNGNYFQAIPVDTETDGGEDICSPLEMMFYVDDSSGGPKITLGFDDVDYPNSYKKQVVRVGLEQLKKMKEQGYKLHIPVRSFEGRGHSTDWKIYFPEGGANLTLSAVDKNAEVLVPATTDPVLIAKENPIGTVFAKIVSPTDEDRAYVDATHMYLPLDLSVCKIDFHEGYEYEVSTSFLDERDEEPDVTPCFGDLFLVIKVVPEFVTWDAHQIGTTEFYSANWYNDDNWKRSVRKDLYKDANVTGKKQNTSTPGHPNGYDDDTEIDERLAGNPGYVPMKFTHVTLLSGNHAPSLINERRVEVADGRSGANQGGSLIDPSNLTGTQMLTDTSPYTHLYSSYPTDNIRYDMMVRYGDHAHGGEGCFGHRYIGENGWGSHSSGSGHSYGLPDENAKVFDVEKFYGNTCKEIYFKPGAELLRQQRLYYQKAWVETELVANKWSLVSTPLQKTFAGDMYVPAKMNDLSMETPAEKPGRQMTEAFQPISFSTTPVQPTTSVEEVTVDDVTTTITNNVTTSQPAYSRTKYPIYQRSWNTSGSTIYTKTNDARATDYSANLGYTTVNGSFVEWSHTYNDVQVPYTTLNGFSIRADRKQHKTEGDNPADVPALIRLPKADDTYDYYDWSDQNEATGDNAFPKLTQEVRNETDVVGKTYYYGDNVEHNEHNNYRFIVDGPSGDGVYTVQVSDVQKQGNYLLLGNPCMASIDMAKFFEENTGLAPGYWTFVDGVASTRLTEGIVRPLQGFFVKNNGATEITFNRGMTIDGNFPAPTEQTGGGSRLFAVKLHATTDQGGSSAELRLNDHATDAYTEGEDVETLFDSNLASVPMVYTVADGQAVSIDQRPTIDLVSFGVVQAENEPVEVQVTSHLLSPNLYFIDALTGEQTPVTDGTMLTVQPNDYGRYFLSTTSVQSNASIEQGIIISVRQQEVTVTANGGQLNMVRATTLNGVAAYSGDAGLGTQCRFQLPKGVYIIQARTEDGTQRQLKVVVE